MEKRFINILTRRFPTLTRIEIEQTVLMAELAHDDKRLVFRSVQCDLTDAMICRRTWEARFPSYDNESFDGRYLAGQDPIFERWLAEEEWEGIVARLPIFARKLAEIAKRYIDTLPPRADMWRRQNVAVMRQAIKSEFLRWHRKHDERAYWLARRTLIGAMRRERRKNT